MQPSNKSADAEAAHQEFVDNAHIGTPAAKGLISRS
jgi:hypothetical protein